MGTTLYEKMCALTLFSIYSIFCFMYVWAWLDPSEAFMVYINLFNEKWVEGPIFLLTFPGIVKMIGDVMLEEPPKNNSLNGSVKSDS